MAETIRSAPAKAPHRKLFIPGPTEVLPDVRAEMSRPPSGHRSEEATRLGERVITKLQALLKTGAPIFLSTSSSTGLMEACVRNGTKRRILACPVGSFGDRWVEIAKDCGKDVDVLPTEWGKAVRPEAIVAALRKGGYDALLLTHNETSTGILNPLAEICEAMREFPDIFVFVDAVSSMGAVAMDFDALGLDGLLAGVQKALACPPGFAIMAVSPRAIERAKTVEQRGFYFDFVRHFDAFQKRQGITTPSLSHMYALDLQLDRILAETSPAREVRHREMAEFTRDWAREHFEVFPEAGYESITLTTIRNTRNIDVAALNKGLAERGAVISNGYGKLKNVTFRIAHMGEIRKSEIEELLSWIDEILGHS